LPARPLRIDEGIANYLTGSDVLDGRLASFATFLATSDTAVAADRADDEQRRAT